MVPPVLFPDLTSCHEVISLIDLGVVQVTGKVFTAATREDIDQWRQLAK